MHQTLPGHLLAARYLAGRFLVAMVLMFAACAANVTLASNPSDEHVIEEVVVVAKQPGPRLWRVRNGDHELWILGTLAPLQEKMQWDASSVEAVLADTDELIEAPGISLDANPLKVLWALPGLWGAQKNPDGKTLAEILPPDLYARWRALKNLYAPKNRSLEKKRPLLAANELYSKALEQNGLGGDAGVHKVIERTAKRHKVKVTTTSLHRRIEKPRAALKEFKRASMDDLECFSKTLARLETDLPMMQTRAQAWADGDIQALRALPYDDQNISCFDAVLNSEVIQDMASELQLDDVEAKLRGRWLAAARNALDANRVSFATLPMQELLDSAGVVAQLTQLGYEVKGP